jgi:uncharacterized protein YcfJ
MRLPVTAAAAAFAILAGPALAHDHSGPAPDAQAIPVPLPAQMPAPQTSGPRFAGFDPAAREAWLTDCRQRLSARDSGIGGAVIGGLVGGVAGNRIAGRHNRTVGTIAGAAVGAIAGAAIDKAEDSGRNRDECEAYLDDYYARYTQGGYATWGYGQSYGYTAHGQPSGHPMPGCCMAQPMMMAPVMMVQSQPHCTETVEYVYEDVPVRPRVRYIPKRTRIVPDKRVKLVPDKRVPTK